MPAPDPWIRPAAAIILPGSCPRPYFDAAAANRHLDRLGAAIEAWAGATSRRTRARAARQLQEAWQAVKNADLSSSPS